MEYPSEEHKSFIVLPHTFPAIRIYEDSESITHLTATTITLKFSCSPIGETGDFGQKAMVGYQRLRTWLEAVIENVIIIDVASPMLDNMLGNVSNMMLFTPGRTDDAMLSALFHSKASAITEDLLCVHSVWMVSTDTDNTERYYRCVDGDYQLPGIEYYNDLLPLNDGVKAISDTPWWTRPTIDICEYVTTEDDTVVWFEVDPLLEIGRELLTDDVEADIIVFDALKKDKDKDE